MCAIRALCVPYTVCTIWYVLHLAVQAYALPQVGRRCRSVCFLGNGVSFMEGPLQASTRGRYVARYVSYVFAAMTCHSYMVEKRSRPLAMVSANSQPSLPPNRGQARLLHGCMPGRFQWPHVIDWLQAAGVLPNGLEAVAYAKQLHASSCGNAKAWNVFRQVMQY